ncbi:MAG: CD1871A family CXXC motif-containing protein [Thermodesulfobacteriota bacterium]
MAASSKKRNTWHKVRRGPFIVITSFLVIWFIGIASGEPVRVLEQAVRVCLSCIGIG